MSRARPAGGRRIRALVYTVITTSIVLLIALAEWATERLVSQHARAAGIAVEIAIVLVGALVFQPIHRRIDAAVEAAFYRRRQRALAALETLRHELTSFKDMGELLHRVVDAVQSHLQARACAVYLHRGAYKAEHSTFDGELDDVEEDHPLVTRLSSSGAPARLEELQSGVPCTDAFPMNAAGELVGFFAVDSRHGRFDAEETHMLGTLAKDLAVAVVALDPRLRARRVRPTNLPADLPPLIGRRRELAEIEEAIERDRLVTLTGSGGVGKTRIALECARKAVDRYEHGAWFVDLSPIRDGALVAGSILAAMNVPPGDEGDVARLIDHLQPRSALIVIDNCEHVLAGAVPVIREVLAACPQIVVVATSRELLHLPDEHVYRLGALEPASALRLFAERAAAVSPAFTIETHERVVAEICERLDGIPLAIELAAARVRALSVEDIDKRLDERFRLLTTGDRTASPRQQTLAATIEWSYELLPPEEQSLFQRLATFRGSFSLPAAVAVCADGGNCDEFHVLDILTSLADKSLIVVTLAASTRYRLLETIRAFAAEKALQIRAASIVRYQHAAYFANLAAQAYHQFDTQPPDGWLERLAPDIDNFRAALEWLLEGQGDRRMGAQLAADCGPVFLRLGLLAEGLRWCDAARAESCLPAATAGRVDYVASMMYNNLQAFAQALECAERALERYRESTDRRGLVRALSQVAQLYSRAHRYDDAAAPAEEAIEEARALGDRRLLASVLRRCAFALPEGEIERTRALFREALDAANAVDDREEISRILTWWATREADRSAFDRAIDLSKQGLVYAGPDAKLYLNTNIACYALLDARYDEALPYALEAVSLALAIGHPTMTALAMAYAAPGVAASNPQGAALLFGYSVHRLRQLEWSAEDHAALFERVRDAIALALNGSAIEPLLERGAAISVDEAVEIVNTASARRRSDGMVTTGVIGDRVGTLLRQ